MKTKQYTVVLLFNKDGSKVLLQTKDRTAFAGMLNGVGGKIEKGETIHQGAVREVEEETTLTEKDIENFMWLGTLVIPEQCDLENPDLIPELYFMAGIIKDEDKVKKNPDSTEEVNWYELRDDTIVTDLKLAGDGDLSYFIKVGRRKLFCKDPVNVK